MIHVQTVAMTRHVYIIEGTIRLLSKTGRDSVTRPTNASASAADPSGCSNTLTRCWKFGS